MEHRWGAVFDITHPYKHVPWKLQLAYLTPTSKNKVQYYVGDLLNVPQDSDIRSVEYNHFYYFKFNLPSDRQPNQSNKRAIGTDQIAKDALDLFKGNKKALSKIEKQYLLNIKSNLLTVREEGLISGKDKKDNNMKTIEILCWFRRDLGLLIQDFVDYLDKLKLRQQDRFPNVKKAEDERVALLAILRKLVKEPQPDSAMLKKRLAVKLAKTAALLKNLVI